jgi:mRNA-degrading endonuclease toxin of MazEF toxin-antitoxin module
LIQQYLKNCTHQAEKTSRAEKYSPIMSTNKGYPFQPPLDSRTGTQGVVLCDQAMFLDLNARHADYIETIPNDTLREIVDILVGFVEIV